MTDHAPTLYGREVAKTLRDKQHDAAADARYIAAVCPDVVLALLDALALGVRTVEWTEGFVVDEPGDGPIETWHRGVDPFLATARDALAAFGEPV